MPSINQERHYQVIKPTVMSVNNDEPLSIEHLAACIAAHSDIAKDLIIRELDRHVGDESTYTYKKRLIETLKYIHHALEQNDVSNNNKTVIASKLTEELNHCSPGFENRALEILLSLQRPTTMDDFLELIRRDIVNVVARQSSDDVHQYNRFFNYAATHYGVRPINVGDVYAFRELDENEQTQLKTAFNTHYRFARILDNLLNVMKSELSNYYGYHGSHEEGYNYDTYKLIVDLFRQITNTPEATYEELLVIVNDDTVTDVNWLNCHQLLIDHLHKGGFIELTDSDHDLFNALNASNPSILESLLKHDDYRNVLKQLDIVTYPDILKHYPEKNTQVIISHLLVCHDDELTLQGLHNIIAAYKTVYSKQPDTETIVNWLNQHPRLTPQFKAEYLMFVLKHDEDNFPYALKLMLEQNSIDEQGRILSATNQSGKNLLLLAAKSSADALIALLGTMKTLPLKLQETLWSKKHGFYQYNVLMNTIMKHPNWLPHLLSEIIPLPPRLQETIWTVKDRYNNYALTHILLHQPAELATVILAIQKLSPEAQKAIWTASCDADNPLVDNALMLAIQHRPNLLPDVMSAIQHLPLEVQDAIWTAKSSTSINALLIAIQHQPESLPTVISAIQKLSLGVQESIWTAKDRTDNNALMLAIESKPALLPMIMSAIEQLPSSTQKDLFRDINLNSLLHNRLRSLSNTGIEKMIKESLNTVKINTQEAIAVLAALPDIKKLDDMELVMRILRNSDALPTVIHTIQKLPIKVQGYIWSKGLISSSDNSLMVAVNHSNQALPAIIGAIQTLLPKDQKTIWTTTDSQNYNVLMHAVIKKQESLPALIQAIQGLPKETQDLIWSAKSFVQDTILMIAKKYKPSVLPILMGAIEQLPLGTQANLLSEKEFTAALNREINSLSNMGLEGSIKTCLQAMHYNKKEKQIAVLTALKELKETAIDGIEASIRQAVNDKSSPLYQALNIKRYPFRFFTSAQTETGSLQIIKNASMLSCH